jgi:aspartyl-tRNA(Asn)/glutamyl-tRNA(Gln) amidotransferase subunit C
LKISKETVLYVADLARLNLSDEESERLSDEMGGILGYMEKLNSLDTSNVKAMEHVEPVSNILREDIVEESFDRDLILSNAPDEQDGAFRVPRVVE